MIKKFLGGFIVVSSSILMLGCSQFLSLGGNGGGSEIAGNPPIITELFAVAGAVPSIYIIAQDEDSDMYQINAAVIQEEVTSFEDTVPITGKASKELNGFLLLKGGFACFKNDAPLIWVSIYLKDRAGNKSRAFSTYVKYSYYNLPKVTVPPKFMDKNLGSIYDRNCSGPEVL